MSKFLENLQKIQNDLVATNGSAMDLTAGQGVKVRDIFRSLEKLAKGEYKTMGDMHKDEKTPFNQQNQVFVGLSMLLKEMGTPVSSVSNSRKNKLEGTQLISDFLKLKGLELPTPAVKKEKTETSETVQTVE